jgi:lipopolysaccharide/colanic/teichoic acid biosynthesis glycosyltransferase
MDVWFVRNRTIGVYLAILARTVPAVLSRRGVS